MSEILVCFSVQQFAQEISQVRYTFKKYGKYAYNDRILFKRVHDLLVCYIRRDIQTNVTLKAIILYWHYRRKTITILKNRLPGTYKLTLSIKLSNLFCAYEIAVVAWVIIYACYKRPVAQIACR